MVWARSNANDEVKDLCRRHMEMAGLSEPDDDTLGLT